jgi:RimJ/RimL family protein N-acetyltransferase
MLEGELIRLRTWRDEDLPVLTKLRNDVELQAQLLARARGSRSEQVREWLQARSTHPDSMLFVIAEQSNDEALGFVQVSDLDMVDGRASLGICLVKQARGRGIGSQTIFLLCGYLRDQWHLRKLSLNVRADNDSALRCYDKTGFVRCGLLREHVFISGRWHDVVLMERFLTRLN